MLCFVICIYQDEIIRTRVAEFDASGGGRGVWGVLEIELRRSAVVIRNRWARVLSSNNNNKRRKRQRCMAHRRGEEDQEGDEEATVGSNQWSEHEVTQHSTTLTNIHSYNRVKCYIYYKCALAPPHVQD